MTNARDRFRVRPRHLLALLALLALVGWLVATAHTVAATPPRQPAPGAVVPVPAPVAVDPDPVALSHGPFLGAVSDRSVKVWARASRSARLQVDVKPSDEPWPGRTFGPARLGGDADFTGVVTVDGLSPGTEYEYRTVLTGRPAAGGRFRTLPATGQPGVFRFVLGGDLDERFAPFSILDHVREQRAVFGFLLGDLIYSDLPQAIPATVEAYRAKYQANWSDAAFRRLTADTPFFTMWDDHEIANDYDGADRARYQAARTALDEYAGWSNPTPRRAGALYYAFQVADVDFFVLDTRSHRDRNTRPDGDGKSMLGPDQKADLKGWLASSRAPFKVVLSSVPFHDLSPGRPDDWSVFATERTELLDYIRQRDIPGVVILSGDQHWTSLVHLEPYGVWELNATPLAQDVRARPPTDDPRLVLAYHDSTSFGVVDVDTRGPAPRLTVSVVDSAGQVRGTHTVASEAPSAQAAAGTEPRPALAR